jgi:hypothetical protein
MRTDLEKYNLYLKMGDKERAYFYLQRDLYSKDNLSFPVALKYYKAFKNIGLGIPDYPDFIQFDDEKKAGEA